MSVQGLGTDEESLIEILCSRSSAELVEIKKVYKESKCEKVHKSTLAFGHSLISGNSNKQMCVCAVFKKDLEKDVAGDTSGNFAKLLLALVAVRNCLHSVQNGTLLPCTAYYKQHSSLSERFFCLCTYSNIEVIPRN